MQTVSTPIPLYVPATLPAYNSVAATGVTAYNLQTAPVVALTTGVDGTVSITLVDGNVTYVANTATSVATNSYQVDPGQAISAQPLAFYSSSVPSTTNKLGSVLVNWGGPGGTTANVPVTGVTLNSTSLTLTAGGATGALLATVAPTTATNQAVTWTSSNMAVATVSASGVVTPLTQGTTTITATTTDGAKTAISTVTVTPAGTVGTAWATTPSYAGFGSITGKVDPTVVKTITAVDTATGAAAIANATIAADGTFTINVSGHQITTVTVKALNAAGTVVLTQAVTVGL